MWYLNVVVLIMQSWKCEIPTDVHDSHSTVAMAQPLPGKMSMDFSLSGFLTLFTSEVLLTITSFFSGLNSGPQPPYTPDHLKQHLEAGESSSSTHVLLLFTFSGNPFPEHHESKARKVHFQQMPCTEVKILNYSPRPKNK